MIWKHALALILAEMRTIMHLTLWSTALYQRFLDFLEMDYDNMKKDYVLGIDMGTGGARVGIFDLQGNVVVFADESYPLYTPKSGWAEQKSDEWWAAICKASRRAIDESGIDPTCIIGMSVDTTCCTVLLVDDNIEPIRPALMWMDVRASEQAKRITSTKDPALKYNGYGNVSAEWMPCKALWLKENEPENYNRATYVLECIDWLMYKLTGVLTASINTTSARWYYDRPNGGFPRDFYAKIGLDDLIGKFPSDVVDMGVATGKLTRSAAVDLGLVPGIVVGEGGADAFVGMLGLNVVEPGRMALITGSSHLHLGLTSKEIHTKGMFGAYPDAVVPGLYMVEGGQISTGSIVNWFQKNFCGDIRQQAQKQQRSVYDILNEQADELPVGSEGLMVLDYFQGNRTPYSDSDVRGMIYGLSLNHRPAHIYRAIIEAICYGTELIFSTFDKAGIRPSGVYISGGAVKSELWLKTHANVSNVPIYVPKVSEAPCLGSALLGAVAAGAYGSIREAAENMITIERKIEPDDEKHQAYQFYFKKYEQAYHLMKDWMHEVTLHNNA